MQFIILIVSRSQFEFHYIIGRGGFGKVWKVTYKKNKIPYALKEMQKVKVIDKKSENSIKYERELLSRLNHPFIVNMHYSFQDAENLYLVLDLLNGGDLRYHISRHRTFSEVQTTLEYIHSKNIIHRDIKPENLVLDDKGFVRVTDFGIAKLFDKRNSCDTSGTPGYMAPEVMNRQNHTAAVDYFAVGVMGYEFMLGRRPYVGKSRKEIKERMMTRQASISLRDIPDGWSEEAGDFFNLLLQRKPENRLGFKGDIEVKEHPWIKFFPWKILLEKKMVSPFIPEKKDNFDKRYCEAIDKIGLETKMRYHGYKNGSNFTNKFINFTYYGIIEENFIERTMNDNNDNNNNTSLSRSKGNMKKKINNTIITIKPSVIDDKTTQLKRITSSNEIQRNSKNQKEINNSFSSFNIFKYHNYINKNKVNSTNKTFIKKKNNISYKSKALGINSNKNRDHVSLKSTTFNKERISKTPLQGSLQITSNIVFSSSRFSTPISKNSKRVSASNFNIPNSYSRNNKNNNQQTALMNRRPFIFPESENLTSSLLKKIMMSKRISRSVNLKRSKSSCRNLSWRKAMESPINSSISKSNRNWKNFASYKEKPHLIKKNIDQNYREVKNYKKKIEGFDKFNRKEIKIEDKNNVNVSVVVINNGIINLNSNSNVNGNLSRRKILNSQRKYKPNNPLKASSSVNFLFDNYKIGKTSKYI